MRGIRSEPFGITTGFIQAHDINPEGSSSKAEDSVGDVRCEEVFGQYSPVEATYKVCRGGSFDSTVKLGEVKTGYVITRIVASRSNKDALSVAVTGIPTTVVGDTATLPTYTIPWPAGYMTGGNGAKLAGVTLTAGRVISSSVTAGIENNVVADSRGDPACMGFFAGRVEATNEVQSCDTQPAAAAAANWTLSPGSGAQSQSNTDYETATFQAFRNIIRD